VCWDTKAVITQGGRLGDQPDRYKAIPGGGAGKRHPLSDNKIHWVGDVVFAEDHQNVYLGAAAHGMSLFRNLAIGLIRLAGHTQIKRTVEHIAAERIRILPLLAASHP
jgi:hypothetical protein